MRRTQVLLLSLCSVALSHAAEQINWYSNGFTATNQPNYHTGSINFQTLAGKLIGNNIDIDVLQGLQTGAHANTFVTCFSCRLDFTTGTNVADTSGNWWTFGSTASSITVRGGFDLNGNGILDSTDIQPGTLLLSGSFTGLVAVVTPAASKPDLLITASSLMNIVNTSLANFYGIAGGYQWNGYYSQTVNTTRPQFATSGAGKGHYKVKTNAMRNGLLQDTLVTPEPTDLALGTAVFGVLAACVVARRRKRAAVTGSVA
jgi:hypothetical protein